MSLAELGGGDTDEGSVEISGRCLLFFAKFAAVDKYLSFPFLAFEVTSSVFYGGSYILQETTERQYQRERQNRPEIGAAAIYNVRELQFSPPSRRCSRARGVAAVGVI